MMLVIKWVFVFVFATVTAGLDEILEEEKHTEITNSVSV